MVQIRQLSGVECTGVGALEGSVNFTGFSKVDRLGLWYEFVNLKANRGGGGEGREFAAHGYSHRG